MTVPLSTCHTLPAFPHSRTGSFAPGSAVANVSVPAFHRTQALAARAGRPVGPLAGRPVAGLRPDPAGDAGVGYAMMPGAGAGRQVVTSPLNTVWRPAPIFIGIADFRAGPISRVMLVWETP